MDGFEGRIEAPSCDYRSTCRGRKMRMASQSPDRHVGRERPRARRTATEDDPIEGSNAQARLDIRPGAKQVARAGQTIHVPANAPHQFHNSSTSPARMHCICSPAGQEDFFVEIGVPVPTRTTLPPKLDGAAQSGFKAKAAALAPKYRTELLQHA